MELPGISMSARLYYAFGAGEIRMSFFKEYAEFGVNADIRKI